MMARAGVLDRQVSGPDFLTASANGLANISRLAPDEQRGRLDADDERHAHTPKGAAWRRQEAVLTDAVG
jgi:hypothetical protein